MRSVSPLWRSFVLVAVLLLVAPTGLADNLNDPLQARVGGPPGVAAQSRLSLPPGSPAAEEQSLWTRLMTWFLYYS